MTSFNSSVTVQPLRSSDFISTLHSFLEVLHTCKRTTGGIKILVTSGGVSIISSASRRLLNNLVLTNPLCVMVSQVMKSQITAYGDYGLYTGVLACSVMEKILVQDGIPHCLADNLVQRLSSIIFSLISSDCIKLSLDFTTVRQLLPVVQTILSSKPACGITKAETKLLSVKIVKAFLNTLTDNVGEVILLHAGACDGKTLFVQGVLYQTLMEEQYFHTKKLSTKKDNEIRILLFSVMLTPDMSLEHRRDTDSVLIEKKNKLDVITQGMYIFQQAVKYNVGIVACQKVVHDSLRMFLLRNNIILLERMGTELTKAVEKLSGAKPICNLENLTAVHIESCLGTVGSAKLVELNKKQYILLEKEGTNVATLLLHAPGKAAYLELKVVAEQALEALRQLVHQPFVTPGAGCLEAWLAAKLQLKALECHKDFSCTKLQLQVAIGWLQRALLSAAGFSRDCRLVVDSIYCHAWRHNNCVGDFVCCCGLVRDDHVRSACGKWIDVNYLETNDMLFPYPSMFSDEPKIPGELHNDVVVDVYASKHNALKLALETCIHMLCVGIIVYKPPV